MKNTFSVHFMIKPTSLYFFQIFLAILSKGFYEKNGMIYTTLGDNIWLERHEGKKTV